MENELLAQEPLEPTRHASIKDVIKLGQWYWIETTHHKNYDYKQKEITEPLLWCAIKFGSNYAEFDHPHFQSKRIHFDEVHQRVKHEPNAAKHLRAEIEKCQGLVLETTKKIEELCLRLGVSSGHELPDQINGQMERAIVPVSQATDTKKYKRALKRAKDKELPKLFEQLRQRNKNLATSMEAETLPLKAYIGTLDGTKKAIEERIFHVELYGGLCEKVKQITEGEPAGMGEHIKVLQRRLYMDEECLLDYQAGGMNFEKLSDFDKWLARPEHRDRILPFPRCVAAFRVRRECKDYGDLHWHIKMDYDRADMGTYLAIRNGENLYRLCTDIDFGEKLFPAKDEFDFRGSVWAEESCRDVKGLWSEAERLQAIEDGRRAEKEIEAHKEKWHQENPDKDDFFYNAPYELRCAVERMNKAEQLVRFSPDNVKYDDISDFIAAKMKDYNRIVLVLQGLLDRSMAFHPHPPLKLWKDADLEFLEPVFDQDRALVNGEAPNFEAYQARLNSLIVPGSTTFGQARYFRIVRSEKASEREGEPRRHYTYGDNGPGDYAKVAKVSHRKKTCSYCWERETNPRYYSYRDPRIVKSWLPNVPMKYLLNVDAYRPGDYKQFFNDPRTRADYLRWAPLLLSAEDYQAKKEKR